MWSNDYGSGPPSKPERANINLPRDQDGNAYLHELCRRDCAPELIREAVTKLDANINLPNKKGLPPLGVAILNAKPETVALLIELGASLNLPTGRPAPFNATYLAANAGKEDALNVILAKGGALYVNTPGIDATGYEGSLNALQTVIRNYHYRLVTPLVKAGAQLNEESGYDKVTPLMVAVTNNAEKTVKELLDAGADMERRQSDTGRTALLYAIQRGERAATRILLDAGANPNAADKTGLTPLMVAAENGDATLISQLLAAGADVNARRSEKNGETPLMAAATRGSAEIVRTLLKAGADPTLTDKFNKTAAAYALQSNNWSTRTLLEETEAAAMQKQFENSYRKYRP